MNWATGLEYTVQKIQRLLALPHRALSLAKEAFESAVRPQIETAMALEIENALVTGDSADAADARDQFATSSRAAGSHQ